VNLSDVSPDDRFQAPSTARNAEPIFDVLEKWLPAAGTVLEIASGSGEHGALFAPRLPHLTWQPSDMDAQALKSIEAWRLSGEATNLQPPVKVDLLNIEPGNIDQGIPGGLEDVSAMINVNMIHISPWAASENLLALAEALLPSGAPLYLYGPYRRGGQHTASSNIEFDGWLKSQNDAWGVRNLEDVEAAAKARSLDLQDIVDMPANNFSLIFKRI
jgi:hypothetical protein